MSQKSSLHDVKSKITKPKVIIALVALGVCGILFSGNSGNLAQNSKRSDQQSEFYTTHQATRPSDTKSDANVNTESQELSTSKAYTVVSVVDGDTIKINYQDQLTSVRLIGVNTPETVDPRKSVECYGQEASNYLKGLLEGKIVTLEADPTQSDRDKYGRLLRYVYLDGVDVNQKIIANGYGYEYTYNIPYQKRSEYKAAQNLAENSKYGLWADNVCLQAQPESNSSIANKPQNTSSSHNPAASKPQSSPSSRANPTPSQPQTNTPSRGDCKIKGNINSKGEKIYHIPGGAYYDKTKIDTGKGERWFCSEQEARAAGWRASKR